MPIRPLSDQVRQLFLDAHCDGYLHVIDVDRGDQVAVHADTLVAAASVFKVQVALEFFRQVANGRLAADELITITPARRTPGPTGISLFRNDVQVSLQDLNVLMLTISDNAATDALMARVGLDNVQALGISLGLTRTCLRGDTQGLLDSLAKSAGFAGWNALSRARSPDPDLLRRALEPERTTCTTAREATSLLSAIWRQTAAPPAACAEVQRLMRHQLARNRLAGAFDRSVQVSAKSGSLLGYVRNEVGMVEPPDGRRYAVAVFTMAWQQYSDEAQINFTIGEVARKAVDHLQKES